MLYRWVGPDTYHLDVWAEVLVYYMDMSNAVALVLM
jgi:hypothetical protein